MKIKHFGTAAAECFPAIFCSCDACMRARSQGGRNLRSRSQALVNDDLLLDFPADTAAHVLYGGLDLTRVRYLFITHSHCDHSYPEDLGNLRPGFAHLKEDRPLDVYASDATLAPFLMHLAGSAVEKAGRIRFHTLTPFEKVNAGPYTVHPLRAVHAPSCHPLFYAIECEGHALLYAHDTQLFPQDTWDYLEKSNLRFDYVSLDCTEPFTVGLSTHMCLQEDVQIRDRLQSMGCADKNTFFIVNHFSHNGKYTHDELVPKAREVGFEVAYDGFEYAF